MPGGYDYPPRARHAKTEPVSRRGLLKVGLVLGATAAPGAAILADHLLTEHAAKSAPRAAGPAAASSPARLTPTASATARPALPARPLAGKVIVLDPGHNPNNIDHLAQINQLTDAGGFLKACNTVGTETDEGYPEWAFNLDVARQARVILRKAGARVIMTQNGHTPFGPCNDEVSKTASAHPGWLMTLGRFLRPHQPGDRVGGLADLLGRGVAAFGDGLDDAVAEVFLQEAEGDRLQCLGRGGDLGEDVDAVLVLFDHPLQAAYLAFDAAQPFDVGVLVVGVPVHAVLRAGTGRGAACC
jgi:hypothetical protein